MADKVEIQFGAQLAGLTAGINQAKEQIEGLTAPVAAVQSAFVDLAAATGVVFAFDRVDEWAQSVAEAGPSRRRTPPQRQRNLRLRSSSRRRSLWSCSSGCST